jgi:hypothetical protein
MSNIISQRLTDPGLHLPEPPIPRGEYVSVVVHGGRLRKRTGFA